MLNFNFCVPKGCKNMMKKYFPKLWLYPMIKHYCAFNWLIVIFCYFSGFKTGITKTSLFHKLRKKFKALWSYVFQIDIFKFTPILRSRRHFSNYKETFNPSVWKIKSNQMWRYCTKFSLDSNDTQSHPLWNAYTIWKIIFQPGSIQHHFIIEASCWTVVN